MKNQAKAARQVRKSMPRKSGRLVVRNGSEFLARKLAQVEQATKTGDVWPIGSDAAQPPVTGRTTGTSTEKASHTSSIYARPSFIEGMARILDFGNMLNEYNTPPRTEQNDLATLGEDWRAIGEDMRNVMRSVGLPAE